MKAMVLRNICNFRENKEPLEMVNLPDSVSGEREINSVASNQPTRTDPWYCFL